MNMLFAIIAAVAMGSPTIYTEKVESVTISIDYQKNQGLSGDIERNEVTSAKISEKSIESVGRISSIPVSVTTSDTTRKTTVYDFKDNKGRRSKDSEVSKTIFGNGYGVLVGTASFARGLSVICDIKDEHGIIDETYTYGKFTTYIAPIASFVTPIRSTVKTANGTIRYAHVNAEDTYTQRGVLSFDITCHAVELGGISRSRCAVTIMDGDTVVESKVLDTCDDTVFSDEIKRFTDGAHTPRSKWRGSASDIMTSVLSTIQIYHTTITLK